MNFGFDAAIDHRTIDFPARLAGACPDGIDVYFRECRRGDLAGSTATTQ
jgi:NADPH-dependent curcumin reductase CurA